jgi:mono/diheme cytochrome c family protein
MLIMIILGLVALLEPARMAESLQARGARMVEDGAILFANNCATCHGVDGTAAACVDAGGNAIGCVGRPLNHPDLLCGDRSARMVQLNWASSKYNLVYQTVAAGRVGTLMPTWGQQFGGPMEDHQVEEVTRYVLNWESPALCGEAEPGGEVVEWPATAAELGEGDADAGQADYGSFGCVGCHGDPATPGSNAVGPWLGNIANDAATRIEGMSAEDYIFDSILHVDNFIAPICARDQPCTSPSAMPSTFGQQLSLEDMANLIAYYMTLSTE